MTVTETHMKQKSTVCFNKNSLQKLDTLHVKNIQLIILMSAHLISFIC